MSVEKVLYALVTIPNIAGSIYLVLRDIWLTRCNDGYMSDRPYAVFRAPFYFVVLVIPWVMAVFLLPLCGDAETVNVKLHIVFAVSAIAGSWGTAGAWIHRIYIYKDADYLMCIRWWGKPCFVRFDQIEYYVEQYG